MTPRKDYDKAQLPGETILEWWNRMIKTHGPSKARDLLNQRIEYEERRYERLKAQRKALQNLLGDPTHDKH